MSSVFDDDNTKLGVPLEDGKKVTAGDKRIATPRNTSNETVGASRKRRKLDAELYAQSAVARLESFKVSDKVLIGRSPEWLNDDQLGALMTLEFRIKNVLDSKNVLNSLRVQYPLPHWAVARLLDRDTSTISTYRGVVFQIVGVHTAGDEKAKEEGNHWCMLVIDWFAGRVVFWDPFGDPPKHRSFVASIRKRFPALRFIVLDPRLQSDATECGLWVMHGLSCYYEYMKARETAINAVFSLEEEWCVRDLNKVPAARDDNQNYICSYRERLAFQLRAHVERGQITTNNVIANNEDSDIEEVVEETK